MRRPYAFLFMALLAFAVFFSGFTAIAGEPGFEQREPTAVAETKSHRYLSWTGNWRFRYNFMQDLDLDDRDFVGPVAAATDFRFSVRPVNTVFTRP